MPLLFAATLFVSAFLLFLVQPMIAQMILPNLGGTPAVWNTCMVFFQAALLAGYAYTHTATTYWPVRRQTLVQVGLLALPFLFFVLPFGIGSWTPATEVNPVWSVLYILLLVVGLPFFVVATSAPLLQRWFVATGHPSAKDPYFLYGASNFGSILALISYPLFFQPAFTLPTQTHIWMYGYLAMIVLVCACGYIAWHAAPLPLVELAHTDAKAEPAPATAIRATPPAPVPEQAVTRKAGGGKRYRPRPVLAAATATPAGIALMDPQQLQTQLLTGGAIVAVGFMGIGALWLNILPWSMRGSVVWWVPIGLVLAGCGFLVSPWVAREKPAVGEITWLRRLRWVALAAAPSSLMLGVTTYMTTDIAAVPLFWIIPLTLYLLSFILVFARWPIPWTGEPHKIVVYSQPAILLICGVVLFGGWNVPTWGQMLAHLAAFFSCVMLCHGELARDRPGARHLTEFYLWMSVGGVIGGMFNSLVAPLIFKHVYEYFIVLVASLLLRPQAHFLAWLRKKPQPPEDHNMQEYLLDLGYAGCLGLLGFALLKLSMNPLIWPSARDFVTYLWNFFKSAGMSPRTAESWARWTELLLVEGIPVGICLCFASRPVRFGLAIGCLMIANSFMLTDESNIIYSNRSFFGVQRVREEETKAGTYHVLIHGGIDHGRQLQVPDKRDQPISYFYPSNPIGQIFSNIKRMDSKPPFAVVGLGIGTLASYSRSGQTVHFYEIDPAVLKLSEPTDGSEPYFWYLHDAKKRGVKLDVILGDGRLKIKDAPTKLYQAIVLDAFSSDAIPVHLMTKEAIAMYLTKLRDDGVLIFNITNRYVSLAPVLADIAKEFDLVCLYQGDYYDKNIPDKFASDWCIMFPKKKHELQVAEAMLMLQGGVPWAAIARTPQFDWTDPLTTRLYLNLSGRERDGRWTIAEPSGRPPWTDHFSDLVRARRW